MRSRNSLNSAAVMALGILSGAALAAPPQYSIVDIGVLSGDSFSRGFRVSPGGIAVGRSIRSQSHGYSWTGGGGIAGLPNLASPARNFGVANAANDLGVVVGTGATTLSGSNRLPLKWTNGTVSQLPLPVGQSLGDANDVNAAGNAVGSVGSGGAQWACFYGVGGSSVITQTTSLGCFANTTLGINDSGLVVGTGIDLNNAARNVGYVLDTVTNSAFEVGALPGCNGALCFDVSNAGHIVGSSMLNQGSSTPFIWTSGGGMVAIPLPTGPAARGRGV